MRRSLPELETIATTITFVVHATRGGRTVPIYGVIRSYYELGSSKRGGMGLISDILHKQVPARYRDQIPTVGEMGTCSCGCCSKAETILSSISYPNNNKPTVAADSAQAGCFWLAGEIGYRAGRVRYRLQTSSSNKGPSNGRLRGRVYRARSRF